MALIRRLLNPAGFALAALCFALPFATASCTGRETPPEDRPTLGSATYTGIDLVIGGEAELRWAETPVEQLLPDARQRQEFLEHENSLFTLDPQPLALLAVLVIVSALAGALLRSAWARALDAVACAFIGLVLVIGAELAVARHLRDRVQAEQRADELFTDIGFEVSPRYGFWLVVGVLGALLLANGVNLVRLSLPNRSPAQRFDTEAPSPNEEPTVPPG